MSEPPRAVEPALPERPMEPGGSRPRTYKTEALVLRSVPVLEADRLITVLTPALGKLRATVRGARRVSSRLGGHVDVLNRVSLSLARGRTFEVVTGAEALETFGRLKGDLDRVALALYLMEMADALVPEESPHPNAYRLLLDSLRVMDGVAASPVIPRYVELRMLDEAGYMPELDRCVICRKQVTGDDLRYGPSAGGLVCGACIVPQGQVLPMSMDALKVLRFFARHGFTVALRLRLEPALGDELESLMGGSLRYVLERDMATVGFIDHLRWLRQASGMGASRWP
jgi:DNA repair protein RecO (recombination protein O)